MNKIHIKKYGTSKTMMRNISISVSVLNGESLKIVAKNHCLSTTRISQITSECCRKANPKLYKEHPKDSLYPIKWLRSHCNEFINLMPNAEISRLSAGLPLLGNDLNTLRRKE
jgi:hypothetical protein